jgi:putative ABC transport system permease protein
MRETAVRSAPNYFAAGLLKPGVSLDSAQAQLTAIAAQLEQQYPDANRGKTVSLTPMREVLVGNSRRTLYLLLGAVAVVLLIAIANLANLLIARFTGRRQEIAVRTALGAGLARTIGQFMAENLLLASLGGTAGLVLASRGWRALAGIWPGNAPLLARAGIDARVLVFTSAILMAVLILSLVPTIYAAQVDASDALRESAASVAVSRRAARLGGLLVSAEVALAVVLLTGAGLFLKSLLSLENVDLGYRPDNVLVMRTSVPASDFHSAQRSARLYKTLLSRLATLPGIQAVGAVRLLPGHAGSFGPYWIDRQSPVESADLTAPQAVYSIVAPRTFAALGIPLPGGRDFDSQDTYDAPFVAIVNRRLAGAAFHGQNPIGRTILCNFDSRRPMTIIGIAGDVQEYGPASPPRPEIYMPYEQHPSPSSALSLVARTVASLESSPDLQRRIVHEVPPGVPVEITTMKASLSHDRAGPRFRAAVLSAFAALALILAIGGVYGVTAYTIKQRSAEIGLRVALGAAPGDILISVLRQGFLLIARGIALGLVAALALSHLFAEMLFEVKPLDPVIHLSVVVLLCASGLAASYFAARRAAFCDPMTVLRHL